MVICKGSHRKLLQGLCDSLTTCTLSSLQMLNFGVSLTRLSLLCQHPAPSFQRGYFLQQDPVQLLCFEELIYITLKICRDMFYM